LETSNTTSEPHAQHPRQPALLAIAGCPRSDTNCHRAQHCRTAALHRTGLRCRSGAARLVSPARALLSGLTWTSTKDGRCCVSSIPVCAPLLDTMSSRFYVCHLFLLMGIGRLLTCGSLETRAQSPTTKTTMPQLFLSRSHSRGRPF
jgi:hypothetical protein